jgi:mono/diheme cytochrome c family protein
MRKVLKYAGYLLLGAIIIAGGFALFIAMRGVPKYEPGHVSLKVEVTPERVARGRNIAGMLCAGCHLDPTTQVLTGRRMTDLPEKFGTVYSRNITQDSVQGIGAWTDGEIAYLLRTGVRRDGSFAPVMSGLKHISDEDLQSIIAFLHSDDPMVKASPVVDRNSDYSFFTAFLCLVAFKEGIYPEKPVVAPDSSDKVAYGRYLVTGRNECYACHSEDFSTVDFTVPENSKGYLAGGNPLLDVNGKTVYSRNITPDRETGIGSWSEAQFSRALREGFRPDNTPVRPPMERYATLSDNDVSAIYAYLRMVPAINSAPKQSEVLVASAAPGGATKGKSLYYKYSCYSCHGENGIGSCDLRGADKKYPDNDALIAWIRDPSKFVHDSKMPTWNGVIAEEDYLPLAEYVRELGRRAAAAGPVARR